MVNFILLKIFFEFVIWIVNSKGLFTHNIYDIFSSTRFLCIDVLSDFDEFDGNQSNFSGRNEDLSSEQI